MQADALVFTAPRTCEVVSYDPPDELGRGEVLLRNQLGLISPGTELAIFCRTHRGFDVEGHWARSREQRAPYDAFLEHLLADGRVRVDPLTPQRVPFAGAQRAYEGLRDHPETWLGVLPEYAVTIRTIHVGARGRGAWPLELMRLDPDFEPVAVVTRDPASFPDPSVARFGDLSSALGSVDCDAVIVCTPVEKHARDVRIAFAAKKHVLVEKCLSNSWAEACSLVVEAESAAVELVVAQNYRYTASAQTLHAAMHSGDYGTAALIDFGMHKYRPAPRQQDYPFAMFWDQGCHHVDDLQWCFGPIESVRAQTFGAPWSRYRDDAAIQALFRFASGATCTYVLSNDARVNELRYLVHTDRGGLRWSGDRWEFSAAIAPDDAPFGWNAPPEPVELPAGLPASGELGVLDAFRRAVIERVPTEISGRANLETLRVCEMVQRAGLTGTEVRRADVPDVSL